MSSPDDEQPTAEGSASDEAESSGKERSDAERDNEQGVTGEDPLGLGLRFKKEPPGLVARFEPRPEHRGPPGLLHGGMAATVLDETMASLGWALDDVPTMTARLELRYRQPVPLDAGPLRIEAWRDKPESRRIQKVHGRLLLADGTVAVEADGLFVQVKDYPRSR